MVGSLLQLLIGPFSALGLSFLSFLHKEFHFVKLVRISPLPGVCIDYKPSDIDNPYLSIIPDGTQKAIHSPLVEEGKQ